MDHAETKKAHNDHNVYILGAGFAADAGLPLIYDFMNRMRDAAAWLAEQGGRDTEVNAIEEVLVFRHRAAGAAYRTPLDVENVEELFSLASARGGEKLAQNMNVAIAATIDFARATAQPATEYQRFDLRLLDTSGWTKPQNWCAPTSFLENFIKTGNDKGQGFGCPPYEFYVGLMAGYFNPGRSNRRDTIITFNYDTVIEDALRGLGLGVYYGIEQLTGYATPEDLRSAQQGRDGIRVLKLHGSVSWAQTRERLADNCSDLPHSLVEELDRKAVVFPNYTKLRERGHVPILTPPTWQKTFSGYLSAVRDAVVAELETATRIVIIGYSIPPTDQHFRFLLSAGLQDNISLRKVIFVNPALQKPDTRKQLEERLFVLFRRDLFDRGTIELVPEDTRAFFTGRPGDSGPSYRELINRPLNPPPYSAETARWRLYYSMNHSIA
jgi:SIR2-like domain